MLKIDEIITDNLTARNEKERLNHRKREPGIFYPSESMQCQRKIYISVIHPERKKDKMPFGLFHMAKYAEESIIKCLQSTPGYIVQEQVRLEKEIAPNVIIHGYEDFKLLNADGDTLGIYEIKSIGNISYIQKAEMAKLHHRSQLQCYLQTEKCDNGSIVYVERGDICKIKEFEDSLDDDLWDDIKTHFSELTEYMSEREMPPPMPVEEWECKYCEFKDKCKEDRKELGLKLNSLGKK
jgi:CRISPR-associated exonuclease Cas4